jgi:hypothetical protein
MGEPVVRHQLLPLRHSDFEDIEAVVASLKEKELGIFSEIQDLGVTSSATSVVAGSFGRLVSGPFLRLQPFQRQPFDGGAFVCPFLVFSVACAIGVAAFTVEFMLPFHVESSPFLNASDCSFSTGPVLGDGYSPPSVLVHVPRLCAWRLSLLLSRWILLCLH